jgi:uncharacterized protein YtpQ (UPF0354 family)
MKKTDEITVTVKTFYDNDGCDVTEILNKSLLQFIEREVEKLCQKGS